MYLNAFHHFFVLYIFLLYSGNKHTVKNTSFNFHGKDDITRGKTNSKNNNRIKTNKKCFFFKFFVRVELHSQN